MRKQPTFYNLAAPSITLQSFQCIGYALTFPLPFLPAYASKLLFVTSLPNKEGLWSKNFSGVHGQEPHLNKVAGGGNGKI
jgi:hypothetical protein